MAAARVAFFGRVYDVVARIPFGNVTTYGAIARALGLPGGARLVGWALAGTPRGHILPAHRVVNSRGELSGHLAFGRSGEMRALLEAEGVRLDALDRVRLRQHLWLPDITANAETASS